MVTIYRLPPILLAKFFNVLFFKGIHGVYWYIYMILGLYLLTPILQKFLQNAGESLLLYACVLITTVFVANSLLPDFLVTKRMISSNSIFLGYFLSGYYVKQYLLQKTWSKPVLNASAILLLLLSFCNQYFHIVNQGIVTYFLSIAVFGTLMRCKINNGLVVKYITFVSRTSYGMYLSHVLLISLFIRLEIEEHMPIAFAPFVMVIMILVIETVMMYV